MKLLLTCEHATNQVPEEYSHLFVSSGAVLGTHRGYDPGAFELFRQLEPPAVNSYWYPWTRLLIEPNRSLGHPQLYSEFSKVLSTKEKQVLIDNYYLPYRTSVGEGIAAMIAKGEEVLHLSVHTFTPVLHGEVRNADVGLLYDPKRAGEKEWCVHFRQKLRKTSPELKVRFNYPYRGAADGFTTYLRRRFPESYFGIEIEVKQGMVDSVMGEYIAGALT